MQHLKGMNRYQSENIGKTARKKAKILACKLLGK